MRHLARALIGCMHLRVRLALGWLWDGVCVRRIHILVFTRPGGGCSVWLRDAAVACESLLLVLGVLRLEHAFDGVG